MFGLINRLSSSVTKSESQKTQECQKQQEQDDQHIISIPRMAKIGDHITHITRASNVLPIDYGFTKEQYRYDATMTSEGYVIHSDDKVLCVFLISPSNASIGEWDIFTEDWNENIIGGKVNRVSWNDTKHCEVYNPYDEKHKYWACLEIETSSGTFYISTFNEHDGYYAHNIYVRWPSHCVAHEL